MQQQDQIQERRGIQKGCLAFLSSSENEDLHHDLREARADLGLSNEDEAFLAIQMAIHESDGVGIRGASASNPSVLPISHPPGCKSSN
eukprot:6479632-Amphidinium_carterae.1